MNVEHEVLQREVLRIDDPGPINGETAGHLHRRIISTLDPQFSDPFLLMGEDWMPRDAFGVHPHRGIETVTFVIEGAVEHYDNASGGGVINMNDAQWMTAGRGVLHKENAPKGTIAHTLQLWINLPAIQKMTEPRYQDLISTNMPVRLGSGYEARVFSGRSGSVTSKTLSHVPITMIDLRLQPGARFVHELACRDNAFVVALDGQGYIGTQRCGILPGQLAWTTRADRSTMSQLTIAASDAPARLLMFAGPPLGEPVVYGGPFVMNTQEEIDQAFSDYREGRFNGSFEPVSRQSS